jgi:hypothetical protein
MFLILQVVTVFQVAVTMSLALAHALEPPGKMRLNKETCIAVQTIYYPGFTYGGFGEDPGNARDFHSSVHDASSPPRVLVDGHCICCARRHASGVLDIHSSRKQVLDEGHTTRGSCGGCLPLDPMKQGAASEDAGEDWRKLRASWEYSHLVRPFSLGLLSSRSSSPLRHEILSAFSRNTVREQGIAAI